MSDKEASDKLPDLVENTIAKREPVLISGKNDNAVLIAESDCPAMNETLHLRSVPGMRDAIQSGMSEKLESISKKLNWSCAFRINPLKLRQNHFKSLTVPTLQPMDRWMRVSDAVKKKI